MARILVTSLCVGALLMAAVAGCRSPRGSASTSPQPGSGSAVATPPAERLPMIDSHVHITPTSEALALSLRIFERAGVTKFAVKSAGVPGEPRYEATRQAAQLLGDRMAFFSNIDWDGIDEPGWGRREADRLEQAMREGASGIKIFKALGLGVRLKNGKLLRVDDPRLEPIWERAARTRAIVAWHVADPVAFFKPIDKNNERYEELSLAPEWSFYGQDFPSYEELMKQRDEVVARHPKVVFLGIHLASYPEDLDAAARLLDRCPNMFVDIAARVPEIGRHPVDKVRAFFLKYQDRILFGTDLIVTPRGMQLGSVSEKPPTFEDAVRFFDIHRRFLETADRNFDHPTPIQGRWKINGINLPRAVLRKIYVDNAERLIFAPRRAWLKAHPGQ
jgi:predicted TIM-barrel fold metal-dependent hydrolase